MKFKFKFNEANEPFEDYAKKVNKEYAIENFQLTNEEVRNSELFLVRIAQYKDFKTEINSLFNHKKVELNSRLYKLRPIFDEQDSLLRITGRAPSSSLIVLPKKRRISDLFVLATHKAHHHLGTVSLMAQKGDLGFYLCGGRNEYKRCTACCNYKSP